MELPQASRPFGPEGRKATHDFLSLRTHSPVQHDPRPSSHGGSCLKTHNFLQPLEKDDTSIMVKEDRTVDGSVDKPPPLLSTEHVLPGGFGTYSISHVSYFNQRMPKPEGSTVYAPAPAAAPATSSNDRNDENSNCSSYTAGSGGAAGFTLWGESSSTAIRGKTQNDDINFTKDSMMKSGQFSKEMPSESSSNRQNNFSSRSSSQPPAHRSQSFMDMIKSAKVGPPTKEEEDDEYFNPVKEGTSHRGELRVKVDGKRSTDVKANTPRSKHSATEQRRRCKINDRLQSLREIIPQVDQKRDKASFLLEVIEYIQFLQEKVLRYESSYPTAGWSGSEPSKPTSWRDSVEGFPDQLRSAERPVVTFGTKEENLFLSTPVTRKEKDPAGVDIQSGNSNNNNNVNVVAFNATSVDQRSALTNKAADPSIALQPEIFSSFRNIDSDNRPKAIHPAGHIIAAASDADNDTTLSQLQQWRSRQQQQHHHLHQQQQEQQAVRTSTDENLPQHQELAVEGGTINISSVYSQGLLHTLTQALQSSGVDLSQASISVQVDVGKRANNNGISAPTATTCNKDNEVTGNGQAFVRERAVERSSGCGDPDQATKRLKKTGQPH